MQVADLDRFEAEFAKLCAGYGVPSTKPRKDAYWAGLRKMSIGQFERCVDAALGEEHGLEQFPTPKGLWRIYRQLAPAQARTSSTPANDPDHLEYFANRLLFQHVGHRGDLGSTGTFVPGYGMTNCEASLELRVCLDFKRKLVQEWLPYIAERDEDATVAEFLRRWIVGLRKLSDLQPRTLAAWEAFRDDPRSAAPFPVHMARVLDPVPA